MSSRASTSLRMTPSRVASSTWLSGQEAQCRPQPCMPHRQSWHRWYIQMRTSHTCCIHMVAFVCLRRFCLLLCVLFAFVCQNIGVDASFLAAAMLRRLETLRRTLPTINKPLVVTVKKVVKKAAAAGSGSGKRAISPVIVSEEEEEGEETAAAAAAKSSRHPIPPKKKKEEPAAAAASAAPAKMKWDTPCSSDPDAPTWEACLSVSEKHKEFFKKNPQIPDRLAAEDKRLLVTGPYLEPEPIKVAEWHEAIDALFNFPVSMKHVHTEAYACTVLHTAYLTVCFCVLAVCCCCTVLEANIEPTAEGSFTARDTTSPVPGVLSRFNSKHPNQVKIDGWDYSVQDFHISPLADELFVVNSRLNDRPAAMFYSIAGDGDLVDMEAMADDDLKGAGKTTDWQRALLRCKKTSSRFFVPEDCMLGFLVPMVTVNTPNLPHNMVPATHREGMVKGLAKVKFWESKKNELGFRLLPATDLRAEPAFHGYSPYRTAAMLEKEKHTEQINARTRPLYQAWLEHAVRHTHTHTHTSVAVSVRKHTYV